MFYHLRRHGSFITFAFRFVYGFRILTPLLLGASGVGWGRFTLLNCLGALTWATLVGCLGYGMGEALVLLLERVKADLRHGLPYILAGLLLVVALVRLVVWYVRRRRAQRMLAAVPKSEAC